MNRKILSSIAVCLVAFGAACGDDGGSTPLPDSGMDSSTPDADAQVGGPTCEDPDEVVISGSISADTTWECKHRYVLSGYVFVQGNSTLTIQPGTTVLGASGSPSGTLIITRGSKLNAVGTAADPIVFTSYNTPGTRSPGDWGGIVLFGSGISNLGANVHFEGTPAAETRFDYGGTDNTHNCGHLEYVRIEFAGYAFQMDKEFNALTVAGCGTQTKISYVQMHRGSDDGIEFFGGAAGFDHILMTRGLDDGLDWDNGWSGVGQFAIIYSEADGDNGIEADNLEAGTGAMPISSPTLWNLTILGSGTASGAAKTKRGVLLRRHTRGFIHNSLIGGFDTLIDVVGSTTNDPTLTADWPSQIAVTSTSFFNGGAAPFPTADDGFIDNNIIPTAMGNNTTNPTIIFNAATNPSFIPTNASLAVGETPSGTGVDATATYRGAVAPNATGAAIWYAGWTTFVSN